MLNGSSNFQHDILFNLCQRQIIIFIRLSFGHCLRVRMGCCLPSGSERWCDFGDAVYLIKHAPGRFLVKWNGNTETQPHKQRALVYYFAKRTWHVLTMVGGYWLTLWSLTIWPRSRTQINAQISREKKAFVHTRRENNIDTGRYKSFPLNSNCSSERRTKKIIKTPCVAH